MIVVYIVTDAVVKEVDNAMPCHAIVLDTTCLKTNTRYSAMLPLSIKIQ